MPRDLPTVTGRCSGTAMFELSPCGKYYTICYGGLGWLVEAALDFAALSQAAREHVDGVDALFDWIIEQERERRLRTMRSAH